MLIFLTVCDVTTLLCHARFAIFGGNSMYNHAFMLSARSAARAPHGWDKPCKRRGKQPQTFTETTAGGMYKCGRICRIARGNGWNVGAQPCSARHSSSRRARCATTLRGGRSARRCLPKEEGRYASLPFAPCSPHGDGQRLCAVFSSFPPFVLTLPWKLI